MQEKQNFIAPGPTIRYLGICASAANLLFLRAWSRIEDPSFNYFRTRPANGFLLGVTLCSVLVFTALLFSVFTLFRRNRHSRNIGEWGLIAFLILPLDYLRTDGLHLSAATLMAMLGRLDVKLGLAVGLCLLIIVAAKYRHSMRGALTQLLLVLLLILPLNIAATAWLLLSQHEVFAKTAAAVPFHTAHPKSRVVWILFDELDQHLVFEHRPRSLNLPEFDRFRSQALYADAVYPPAHETLESLPSLLSGNLVYKATAKDSRDLEVSFFKAPAVNWFSQPSIFSEAHTLGENTGIAGWYHPYCRLFGAYAASCLSDSAPWPLQTDEHAQKLGLFNMMRDQILRRLNESSLIPGGILPRGGLLNDSDMQAIVRKEQLASYRRIYDEAMMLTANPNLDLVFLHLPIPHPFGIYDRVHQQLTAKLPSNYLDNLALADTTLALLRQNMERAGLWDSTVVLVSSDHALRRDQWQKSDGWSGDTLSAILDEGVSSPDYDRIPFMIKLRDQHEGSVYTQPFNSVLSSRVLLAILRGELSTVGDMVAWLDLYRRDSPLLPIAQPSLNSTD